MRKKIVLFASVLFITLGVTREVFGQWTQPDGGGFNYGVTSFAVSGSNLFVSSNQVGIGLSTDNGVTWYPVDSGLTYPGVQTLGVNGTNLFAGIWGGGVCRSTNEGSIWTPSNDSMYPPSVMAFAVIDSNQFVGSYLFAGTTEGMYMSSDSGASWYEDLIGTFNVSALTLIGRDLYAGTLEGVYLSSDDGTTWERRNNGLTDTYVLSLASAGHNLFAGTGSGVFISTDSGASWVAADSGVPQNSAVFSFAASGLNIFAATNATILLSTNNGATWTDVGNGLTGFDTINALALSDRYLFAGTFSRGIYRRPLAEMIDTSSAKDTESVPFNDTGTVSLSITGDSDQSRAHRIDFVNASSDTLTILNATLSDSADRFSIAQYLPGIPDIVFPGDTFSMIVNFFGDTSGTVYLDTLVLTIDPAAIITSYYVYLEGKSFSPSSGVSPISQIPASEIQSYPNPLSQSATIRLSNSESAYTLLRIVNLLGQEVATLFTGELEAGDHSFTWNARGIAPGTYWCLLSTDGRVERIALSVAR